MLKTSCLGKHRFQKLSYNFDFLLTPPKVLTQSITQLVCILELVGYAPLRNEAGHEEGGADADIS